MLAMATANLKNIILSMLKLLLMLQKRIAKEITHEPIILSSAIYCIAGMFKSLSENHDGATALFTKKELDRFYL